MDNAGTDETECNRKVAGVSLYKGKGKKAECNNYKGVSLLSVIGKIYAEVLIDRVSKVTEELTDAQKVVSDQGGYAWIRSLF